jgi:hypothetical protein
MLAVGRSIHRWPRSSPGAVLSINGHPQPGGCSKCCWFFVCNLCLIFVPVGGGPHRIMLVVLVLSGGRGSCSVDDKY